MSVTFPILVSISVGSAYGSLSIWKRLKSPRYPTRTIERTFLALLLVNDQLVVAQAWVVYLLPCHGVSILTQPQSPCRFRRCCFSRKQTHVHC